MGREAFVQAAYDGRSSEAKALLESQGILLRAPFSLTLPRNGISGLVVEGDDLTGQGPRGRFVLGLGAVEAGKWKAALERPLPSLADKLGLTPGGAVWTAGDVGAVELASALTGMARTEPATASLLLVHAPDAAALVEALEVAAAATAPVWVIHGKGKGATFGEAPVRALMRERGFIDTKVSAVSDTLSATRYLRR
jgi:hypothetical protein